MSFWLIQRAKFKKIDSDKFDGIDSLLNFDYMGSAEFEFGALPRALKELCNEPYELTETEIRHYKTNYKFYVISEKSLVADIVEFVLGEMNNRPICRLKEIAEIRRADVDCCWFGIDKKKPWFGCFGFTNANNIKMAVDLVKRKKNW